MQSTIPRAKNAIAIAIDPMSLILEIEQEIQAFLRQATVRYTIVFLSYACAWLSKTLSLFS
jgi:hypothetical protein